MAADVVEQPSMYSNTQRAVARPSSGSATGVDDLARDGGEALGHFRRHSSTSSGVNDDADQVFFFSADSISDILSGAAALMVDISQADGRPAACVRHFFPITLSI